MNVTQMEDILIGVVAALGKFATVESAGRKALPEMYAYPAAFVYFDGDTDTGSVPRPVDEVDFKIVVQSQNLYNEELAAADAYSLNDQVRAVIRGKTLGMQNIEPWRCVSRRCTDYIDDEGIIEYTHVYRTRLYSPVPTE